MMNRLKTHILLWIFIGLSFSCAAHKKPAPEHTVPPDFHGSRIQDAGISEKRKIILHHAKNSLGLPYQWGGRTPETGFDCSGLVVYTHQMADIVLPRTAKAQFEKGRIVSIDHLKIADLVFFRDSKKDKIYHVGIYIGNGRFIHAPGRGRRISYEMIKNPYFLNHYIGARSYL